jgi:hypothetical protein
MDELITVTTKSGFTAEISKDALDDIELLDDLERLDKGDYLAVSCVLRRLLGEKQKKTLYDFCRDPKTGRSSMTRVSAVLQELFTSEELKK